MSLLLFSISVIFYACSQLCAHGKIKDDPDGKYASPKRPGIGLYYRLFGITYKEKYPLAASLLVSFTDRYHRFQLAFKLFLCASIVLYQPLLGYWDSLLFFVSFGIVFTITYRIAS